MHKYAWIAVLALLAACGDDSGNKPGGGGGGDGGGGGEPPPSGVIVTNEAGRTFVSPARAQIIVTEKDGGALAQIEGSFQALEAGTNHPYDVRFRLSESQLINGSANPQLSGQNPNSAGLGKIEVDTADDTIMSKGTTDALTLTFNQGRLDGTVTSTSSTEIAATIEGGYDLHCEVLVDGSLQDDASFSSEFCQPFAAQRPADK